MKIVEMLFDKTVKIKCDGGQEKEDVLASLRTKPELLPASNSPAAVTGHLDAAAGAPTFPVLQSGQDIH